MGNQCCRVINYIDEDEEYRVPPPKKQVREIKIKVKTHKTPVEPIPELEVKDETDIKSYSMEECIITENIEKQQTEISKHLDIDNSSIDIVETASIQSFD